MDARPFDTIHDILECLSLIQSLLEGQNASIWRKREPTHMSRSRTDRLSRYVANKHPQTVAVRSGAQLLNLGSSALRFRRGEKRGLSGLKKLKTPDWLKLLLWHFFRIRILCVVMLENEC